MCIDTFGPFRVQTARFSRISDVKSSGVFAPKRSGPRHTFGDNAMPQFPMGRSWGTFSLRELVEGVCQSMASRLEEQGIKTVLDISATHTVAADRELLHRAVRNLVLNALDAMPAGGTLVATSAAGPYAVELEIADTGESLSEEELHQAFELVPTAQRNGTGWGLAVVRRIAELHGGEITVINCPEGGAAFTLRIPRAAVMQAAA
jgi:signal transduction histidine kinase